MHLLALGACQVFLPAVAASDYVVFCDGSSFQCASEKLTRTKCTQCTHIVPVHRVPVMVLVEYKHDTSRADVSSPA